MAAVPIFRQYPATPQQPKEQFHRGAFGLDVRQNAMKVHLLPVYETP
jgi:hypothetical protein